MVGTVLLRYSLKQNNETFLKENRNADSIVEKYTNDSPSNPNHQGGNTGDRKVNFLEKHKEIKHNIRLKVFILYEHSVIR